MQFDSFLSDVLATVAGGIAIGWLFFFTREKLIPITNMTGMWYAETRTITSAYNPYQNMSLRFTVFIWRDNTQLYGSSEKIYENSVNGERTFVGANRSRGIVTGAISRNYLVADCIYVHIEEQGEQRTSTTLFDLRPYGRTLRGTFSSMVADQQGETTWQRTPFR